MPKPTDKDQARRRAQRLQCLRRELGLEDDAYRDLIEASVGVRSSKGLSIGDLGKVIRRLEALAPSGRGSYPGRPANMATRPGLRKIEALLTVAKRPWSYADGIAKQMWAVDKIEWCDDQQLRGVITALVRDAGRKAGGDS